MIGSSGLYCGFGVDGFLGVRFEKNLRPKLTGAKKAV